jgi:glyoxylate utilization-related uncharacterized protein
VISEARLDHTAAGAVAASPGWFVLNARDARWMDKPGQGHSLPEQEDFLVLFGEAVLIVEGQERRLAQWDFVHCPPGDRTGVTDQGCHA